MSERTCNGCTACCTVYSVLPKGIPGMRVRKEMYEPCQHERNGGCAVYELRARRCGCVAFQCDYLAYPDDFQDDDRPDKSNVVFEEKEERYDRLLIVSQVREGPVNTRLARRRIRAALRAGRAIIFNRPGRTSIAITKRIGGDVPARYIDSIRFV